ncbi:hypothetical protein BDR07DRAFT_1412061 [Suillus spraguei]|nr:hypothetical protein BDR07DRAFT_1412061 [Suillus spraguei]
MTCYLNLIRGAHRTRSFSRTPRDGENPRGDVAVRFWKDLKEGVEQEDGIVVEVHDKVDIEWPSVMIMVKRA